jgi:hypothetical protein
MQRASAKSCTLAGHYGFVSTTLNGFAIPVPVRDTAGGPVSRDGAHLSKKEQEGARPYEHLHRYRATTDLTGITAYLEAGGTLENAQAMAAHESPRTTKLYDRTGRTSNALPRRVFAPKLSH